MGLRTLYLTVLAALFAIGNTVVFGLGAPDAVSATAGAGNTQGVLSAALFAQTQTQPQAQGDDEEDEEDEEQQEEDEEDEEDEEEEEEEEDDLETYESPNFDFTISFDPSTWRVVDETSGEDEAGNSWDFFQLRTLGGAYVSFWGVTGPDFAYQDAQECVFDLATWVAGLEGVDDVEQRDDVDEGDEEDAVIVLDFEYTFEDSETEAFTDYLRCQTIEEEESYLRTWYDIAADDYEDDDDTEDREALLEGVEIG